MGVVEARRSHSKSAPLRSRNTSCRFMLEISRIRTGLMGHLAL